jgi:PKD repeat protein
MDAYQYVLARFNRPGDCKPPRAHFKARQLEGDIAVEFRGKFKIGRGCSLDFHAFDFGDGTKSPTNPVTHAYPQPGTYEAEFRVVDSIQQEMIVRKTVVVREVLP